MVKNEHTHKGQGKLIFKQNFLKDLISNLIQKKKRENPLTDDNLKNELREVYSKLNPEQWRMLPYNDLELNLEEYTQAKSAEANELAAEHTESTDQKDMVNFKYS